MITTSKRRKRRDRASAVDDEIAMLRFSIASTEARIARIRADAERQVSHAEGHIRYLEQRIADLVRSLGRTPDGSS